MKGTLKACTVKVIVDIGGREAIPVRAIPWLTARKRMSADVVADVLSGSYKVGAMVGLVAYRVEGTNVVAVEIQHWKNAARDLGVLRISSRNAHGNKDTPDSHELEHSDWRAQAISLLPAGVFVWKDEFENSYEGTYGPCQRLKNEAALNFTPLIPNEPDRQCVMDGFLWGDPARHADKPTLVADAPEQADTKPQAGAVEAAPVVAVPASEPRPAATGPRFTMTKAAMIAQHEHEWPTINTDMQNANRNRLDAAKAGERGWREADAMEWARSNARLHNAEKPADLLASAMPTMANLPARRHTSKS